MKENYFCTTFSHIAVVIFQTSSSSNVPISFTWREKKSEGKRKAKGGRERESSIRCFGNLDERT